MRAIKKLIEVAGDKSVTIRMLPFKPGSTVEVIVLPAEEGDIFMHMDAVTRAKKIAPMKMKDIEKIIHEARKGKIAFC